VNEAVLIVFPMAFSHCNRFWYRRNSVHLNMRTADHSGRICSNTGVVGANPTRGIDVCVYSVFVLFPVGQWPSDGLIHRPRSPRIVCEIKKLK
jgi:hypothetical protein